MSASLDQALDDTFKVLKSVKKPPLRKGRSYVLKSMQLDAALAAANLGPHVDLVYWEPTGGSILQAFFWQANANCDYDRSYVRAGFVPSERRFEAARALSTIGLPRFVVWVRAIMALLPNSTIFRPEILFDATYGADGLCVYANPSA